MPAFDGEAVIGTSLTHFRVNDKILLPEFLAYYFSSSEFQTNISSVMSHTTRNQVPITEQRRLWIRHPPVHVQRDIVGAIRPLFDKIEANRKAAACLEEMARALYRSWFVTFDPVHAKSQNRPPAHMPPTTAALFPDGFGENGLPEGWALEPIGKHVLATKGLSYKGAGLCGPEGGVPLHNLNSVLEGGGYKYEGIKHYSGDFKDRHLVRPGDLIVANTEQGFDHLLIGHSALVPESSGSSGLFSHHLYKVEPRDGSPLSREWLYLALSVAPLGTVIRSYSNGTTVNMLPADAFELPLAIVPPEEVVSAMSELVRPWFGKRDAIIAENQTLATLRDTLLPRLMSGSLRVKAAQVEVEAVL